MREQAGEPAGGMTRREFVATSMAAGAVIAMPGLARGARVCAAPVACGLQTPAAAEGAAALALTVNGQRHPLGEDTRATLLDVLREQCGLTGTKKGCDHGQCGACTVLVDGQRVLACLTLAAAAVGTQIVTIEGLSQGGQLHTLQSAFIKHDAFQCGFCTPGQICSATGMLREGRARTDDEIRAELSGNLCRCGAYPNILAAVKEALAAGV